MKTPFCIILSFVLVITINLKAQITHQWSSKIGTATTSEYGKAITSDPSGNVYVTGTLLGTVFFGAGPGSVSLTSNGGQDIFIAKYSSAGNFIWAINIGGSNDETPYDLVADGSGVYLAGIFKGTVDFDPTSGTTNVTYLGGGTDGDGFFAKYNASGNLVWVDRLGSTANDRVMGIAIDNSQNVYVTGYIGGNTDMDPGSGVVTFSTTVYNAFFAKYSSTGTYLFAKQIVGPYSDCYDINLDATGNIYITGSFSQTNDFNPGAGTANLSTSSALNQDVYIAKYDATGNYLFAKQIGSSTSIDIGFQIVLDANSNIYLGGTFTGTCDFDPSTSTTSLTSFGQGDLFVAKYNNSGTFMWVNGTGGTTNDYARGVAVDPSGNVYVTGKFQGTNMDFDPSVSQANLTGSSATAYLASYSSSGAYRFAYTPGNIASDGMGIFADNSSVYITGLFTSTADFDFSASASSITSLGGDDVFIAKYSTCTGVAPTLTITTSNTLVCTGQTVILTTTGANSYVWSNGATTNTIAVSPTVTTTYSVTGTNLSNCSANASITQSVSLCTGIESINVLEELYAIYPIPFSDELIIKTATPLSYVITNNIGQIILSENTNSTTNTIDTKKLAKGIYYIELTHDDLKTTKKIIKQ